MTQIQDIHTTVLRNIHLCGDNYLVEFDAAGMAAEAEAGQFVMVGIPGSDILLRRPFSICGLPGTFHDGPDRAVQLLYKVVGKGTRLLSTLGEGARLTVLGPLGTGFSLPGDGETLPVLVAGGIGSAPFPALSASITAGGGRKPLMFYGAGTESDLPLLREFREGCSRVVVSTDDGSTGFHGLVTETLNDWLDLNRDTRMELYCCGPEPMLRAVRTIALERSVPCQLSLEAYMACGFGVCIGCVVPTIGPHGQMIYERVCSEGPVMRAERLAW